MAADPPPVGPIPTPRWLLIAVIATLTVLVVALVLAVVTLHQPTLTPVSLPSSSSQ